MPTPDQTNEAALPCAAPPPSPPTPDPIRAALQRLVELEGGHWGTTEWVSDLALAFDDARNALSANPAASPPSGRRPFASLTRTIDTDGFTVLDAIDTYGRAWWLVLGDDAAPIDWTELEPLPTYEEQP